MFKIYQCIKTYLEAPIFLNNIVKYIKLQLIKFIQFTISIKYSRDTRSYKHFFPKLLNKEYINNSYATLLCVTYTRVLRPSQTSLLYSVLSPSNLTNSKLRMHCKELCQEFQHAVDKPPVPSTGNCSTHLSNDQVISHCSFLNYEWFV